MVISTRERVVDHQERVPLHPPGMFSVPWLTAGNYRCSGKPPSPGRRRPRTMGEAAHAHGIKAAAAGGAEDGHITAVQARGCASQITTDSATNASKIRREDAADRTDGGACAPKAPRWRKWRPSGRPPSPQRQGLSSWHSDVAYTPRLPRCQRWSRRSPTSRTPEYTLAAPPRSAPLPAPPPRPCHLVKDSPGSTRAAAYTALGNGCKPPLPETARCVSRGY